MSRSLVAVCLLLCTMSMICLVFGFQAGPDTEDDEMDEDEFFDEGTEGIDRKAEMDVRQLGQGRGKRQSGCSQYDDRDLPSFFVELFTMRKCWN
ncbi:hypothetical protein Bpfe_009454 [Biomphalaria pfeifferi]|uniref:Uncharacterized protein n=1 Tax=Biomphalaria pfeifferi TaxID=112525 RepID=A0AAD8FEV3_BIOPF|nr:hypothetical protein Bpfe_009454 [Biomphalaria pfeifferi]